MAWVGRRRNCKKLTANAQRRASTSQDAIEEVAQTQETACSVVTADGGGRRVAAGDDLAIAAGHVGTGAPHVEVGLGRLGRDGLGQSGQGGHAEGDGGGGMHAEGWGWWLVVLLELEMVE